MKSGVVGLIVLGAACGARPPPGEAPAVAAVPAVPAVPAAPRDTSVDGGGLASFEKATLAFAGCLVREKARLPELGGFGVPEAAQIRDGRHTWLLEESVARSTSKQGVGPRVVERGSIELGLDGGVTLVRARETPSPYWVLAGGRWRGLTLTVFTGREALERAARACWHEAARLHAQPPPPEVVEELARLRARLDAEGRGLAP